MKTCCVYLRVAFQTTTQKKNIMTTSNDIHFAVEIVIFDKNHPVTKEQHHILEDICMGQVLHDILKESLHDHPKYKYLPRSEPAIASHDETSQLRLEWYYFQEGYEQYHHSLHFHQLQSTQPFSMEDLKELTLFLKRKLEEYLCYSIDAFIYLKVDDDED